MYNNSQTTPWLNLQKAVFIVLLLFSIHFWDLRFFPKKFNIENMLVWSACIASFFLVLQKKNMLFRNAIIFFMFGLLLNAYAGYVNLDQLPRHSILTYGYYYFILIYFLLHFLNPDRQFLEKTILIFGGIYSFIFIVQYLIYPYDLFNRDVSTAVQEVQLEILGHGFLMLSYFLVLNRYLINRKLINLILAVIFFLVLLKSGFRTLVFGAIISSVIMVIMMLKLRARDFAMIFLVGALLAGILQFKSVSATLDEMIFKTGSDIRLGNKYVRALEMEFFFKKYPQNWTYYVIGGGRVTGKNLYVYNPSIFGMNYNIVWVDIGLLGFFIVIGAVATIGLVWYSVKAIFVRLPKERYYLRLYFLYLLIVSLTNEEIYRNGIFSVQAIVLYLIDITVSEESGPIKVTEPEKEPAVVI